MIDLDAIREDVRSIPILGSVAAVGGDLLLNGGDIILSLIASLAELFPVISLVSGSIAPQLAWIPTGLANQILLVAAISAVGIRLYRYTKE